MILLLSDTHIGDRQSDKNLNKLFNVLEKYGKKENQLILNGDIIDVAKTKNVDKRHRRFISLIMRFGHVYYIEGNHDWFFSGFEDIFPHFSFLKNMQLRVGQKKVFIAHGHQVDCFVQRVPFISRWLVTINKWLDFVFKIDFQHLIRKCRFFGDMSTRLDRKMLKKSNGRYDVVVIGHTHTPRIIKEDKTTLYNTGGWTDKGECYYLTIEDESISMKKI